MMISRILLVVACLSLLTASPAEAQLFRRFRSQPQPQRYAPNYSQNGYQGQLRASQPSRPVYVRRADGSVVRYFPNNNGQQPAQAQPLVQPRQTATNPIQQNPNKKQNVVTIQGQLGPVARTPNNVAPVGVSVLNGPERNKTVASITPATEMPEASVATMTADPASSIPVSDTVTNPAPQGLSLSVSDDEVVAASADIPVKSMSNSTEKKAYSVLEFIE